MGKYFPLTRWLSGCTADSVKLSFSELETILGFSLPDSAYRHNRWWMNDFNHSQAKSWMDAGYATVDSYLPLTSHTVEFARKLGAITNRYLDSDNLIPAASASTPTPTPNESTVVSDGRENNIVIGKYTFCKTPFAVFEKNIQDTFLRYDGPLVKDLLKRRHYCSLRHDVEHKYPQMLNARVHQLMEYLVQHNDSFYLNFLNKNGGDDFCRFGLTDRAIFGKRGLYLYEHNGSIKYIGRCRDNYFTRFNVNYGDIQPINCYKGGQSTNTHINSLMNRLADEVSIYLCPLTNQNEINCAETDLITRMQPEWNRRK